MTINVKVILFKLKIVKMKKIILMSEVQILGRNTMSVNIKLNKIRKIYYKIYIKIYKIKIYLPLLRKKYVNYMMKIKMKMNQLLIIIKMKKLY
jgi:hypothetical protein